LVAIVLLDVESMKGNLLEHLSEVTPDTSTGCMRNEVGRADLVAAHLEPWM